MTFHLRTSLHVTCHMGSHTDTWTHVPP